MTTDHDHDTHVQDDGTGDVQHLTVAAGIRSDGGPMVNLIITTRHGTVVDLSLPPALARWKRDTFTTVCVDLARLEADFRPGGKA